MPSVEEVVRGPVSGASRAPGVVLQRFAPCDREDEISRFVLKVEMIQWSSQIPPNVVRGCQSPHVGSRVVIVITESPLIAVPLRNHICDSVGALMSAGLLPKLGAM